MQKKQFTETLGNNQLSEKLSNVRGQIQRAGFNLPLPDDTGIDGINHINIWEKAATEFGIILDQYQDTPFEHSLYGYFKSVEGFLHYLRSPTRDDRNRSTSGFNAKKLGNKVQFVYVNDFRYMIMNATWQKIINYPAIVKEMKASVLPFDMYSFGSNNSNIRIRPKAAFWMIPGMEEIRKAIKENREPDLNFLLDNPNGKPPILTKAPINYKPAKLTGMFTNKQRTTQGEVEQKKEVQSVGNINASDGDLMAAFESDPNNELALTKQPD